MAGSEGPGAPGAIGPGSRHRCRGWGAGVVTVEGAAGAEGADPCGAGRVEGGQHPAQEGEGDKPGSEGEARASEGRGGRGDGPRGDGPRRCSGPGQVVVTRVALKGEDNRWSRLDTFAHTGLSHRPPSVRTDVASVRLSSDTSCGRHVL